MTALLLLWSLFGVVLSFQSLVITFWIVKMPLPHSLVVGARASRADHGFTVICSFLFRARWPLRVTTTYSKSTLQVCVQGGGYLNCDSDFPISVPDNDSIDTAGTQVNSAVPNGDDSISSSTSMSKILIQKDSRCSQTYGKRTVPCAYYFGQHTTALSTSFRALIFVRTRCY
jgi:hypothetical protein